MKTSEVGLALIKHYEGFYSKPYKCPANYWTVGYGHLIGNGIDLPDNWNRHFSVEEAAPWLWEYPGELQSVAKTLLFGAREIPARRPLNICSQP